MKQTKKQKVNFTKKLIQKYRIAIKDVYYPYVDCEISVGIINLADGRKAQVSVKVNADKDSWID